MTSPGTETGGTASREARATLDRNVNMQEPTTADVPRAAPARTQTKDTSIRPFEVHVSGETLANLRQRIKATQWPEKETVADDSQGVPLALMQNLAHHWATDYDWRTVEAKLNALPQFITEIDGLDIHFIHVRSKHENALPLIVTHGWPGSIIEQLKIIDPLTNPTAHGGSAADAFHVVIPSMPGYGFSGKPTTTGWDPARIARAWVVLMKRLGYTKFAAQGGDWGAVVTEVMAAQAPAELLGIHTNMPGAVPPEVSKAIQAGGPPPADLSGDEKLMYEKLQGFFAKAAFWAFEMATRPQTLYGLVDSPVALAAWLIDHGDGDAEPAAAITAAIQKSTKGHSEEELTRDDVLDNITLYWLTSTGISSARLYWENKFPFFDVKNVSIPVAVSVFPGELYQAPESWAKRAFPKLLRYNRLEKGGHYAAWEQPMIFTTEVRAGLRSLR
jgi:pimeloyl-ACP methyl ester carboxylesterase